MSTITRNIRVSNTREAELIIETALLFRGCKDASYEILDDETLLVKITIDDDESTGGSGPKFSA